MLVSDHVNGLGDNPLIGSDDPEAGSRFVDMSRPYVASALQHASSCAVTLGLTAEKGIYWSTRRNVVTLGLASGTGIAPEAILAAQANVPVLAIVVPPDRTGDEELAGRVVCLALEIAGGMAEIGNGAVRPGHTALS